MSRASCVDVQALAPEFALGLLSGPERAAVVEHLARCAACRELVEGLAATVDELLPAGPVVEPPVGFETRMLERLPLGEPAPVSAPPAARRRWSRPAWQWCAAAAVAVALLAGGLLAGRLSAPDDARSASALAGVRQAPMVVSTGRRVGRVVVGVHPDTVFVAVPRWDQSGYARDAKYRVRVTLAGGRTTELGPVRLNDGTWGGRLPVDGTQVRDVAMIDRYGNQYCAAHFGAWS